MRDSTWTIRVLLATGCLGFAVPARAQCFEWVSDFGPNPDGTVLTFVEFDDGTGPALYVGGLFTSIASVAASHVAKWNGTSWSPLGAGVNGEVDALEVFDDGSGPALYAGGNSTTAGGAPASRIAKWNGTSWSALGSGLTNTGACSVFALRSFDDGSGTKLYVGGQFDTAGGLSANDIARWDGANWSTLGAGSSNSVQAMLPYDDGSGPALVVAGDFDTMSGVTTSDIAKWNGTSWSTLGGGTSDGIVYSLASYDDGSGALLFAGGAFSGIGLASSTANIGKWNGASWSAVYLGVTGTVRAMSVFDDGSGSALYAGQVTAAGVWSTGGIARWDGVNWSRVGADLSFSVRASTVYDDGSGPALYLGGENPIGAHIAKWRGTRWYAGAPLNGTVRVLATLDTGSGPTVFAGGDFTYVGGSVGPGTARLTASGWVPLSFSLSPGASVRALAVANTGSGARVYAGGDFFQGGVYPAAYVASWTGSNWDALGTAPNDIVAALCEFDDGSGSALFAGGEFTIVGGTSASYVAKWNGTSWSALGAGTSQPVSALAVFDDGTGAALYAAGAFLSAGGAGADHVAKWNGASWSPLGAGTDGPVSTLYVHDDGTGAALYAGGTFTNAGGAAANNVAKWNGTSWSPLGAGTDGPVLSFTTARDLDGLALVVGGAFASAGGTAVFNVARWDGSAWSALDIGFDDAVHALVSLTDATDAVSELFVGGAFTQAGGGTALYLMRRTGCDHDGESYCGGDGVDPLVTTPCPCGNYGDPGRGCANANPALGGAQLTATGTTNPNTMLMTCAGIPNNNLSTFLRGTANVAAGSVFGDGVKCIGGTTLRFGQQLSGQNGNPTYTVIAAPFNVVPGNTRYYQCQYRAPGGFCTPQTFNVSNGYRVTW